MRFDETEEQLKIWQSMSSKKLKAKVTKERYGCFSILKKEVDGFYFPVSREDIDIYRTVNDWEKANVSHK